MAGPSDQEIIERALQALPRPLSSRRAAELFPFLSPNDLSRWRKGKYAGGLQSEEKREGLVSIYAVWSKEGQPRPERIAEALGYRSSARVEFLKHFLTNPAWEGTGVSLDQRYRVGDRFLLDEHATEAERHELRLWFHTLKAIEAGGHGSNSNGESSSTDHPRHSARG